MRVHFQATIDLHAETRIGKILEDGALDADDVFVNHKEALRTERLDYSTVLQSTKSTARASSSAVNTMVPSSVRATVCSQ